MKNVFPVKEYHEFRDSDLIGGHAALDFVNTMTGRNGTARDWLPDPAALAAWAYKADVLTKMEWRELQRQYSIDRRAAEAALGRAVGLREAMYAFLVAITDKISAPAESLEVIEKGWRKATQSSALQWVGEEGLRAEVSSVDADVVWKRVALSLVRLGRELASDRLRMCRGQNCAWFFFDTSKAGRRRWCDMAVCGNAAKYARANQRWRSLDHRDG